MGPLLEPEQILNLEGPEPTRFTENGLQFAAASRERGDLAWLGRVVLSNLPFAGYFTSVNNQKALDFEKEAAETPEEKEERIEKKKANTRRKWVNGAMVVAGLVGWCAYVIYGAGIELQFVEEGDFADEEEAQVRHSGHRDENEEEEDDGEVVDVGPDLSDEDNEGIEDQLVGIHYDDDDDDDY